MPESSTLSPQEASSELARIRDRVDSGDFDLRSLGFWKLVGGIKRDPELVDACADEVGEIDWLAFKAFAKVRFPVWVGNLVLAAGIAVGAALIVVAREASEELVAGLALVLAAGIWAVAVHSPTHWLVGRFVGLRFRCYFFGGPFPPRPGLKTDYASYLRCRPRNRAVMHASGALATKAAPFVALIFWRGSGAPAWAAWVVLAIGIVQILTDVFLSTKSSDWKKVKRELAVARAAG